MSRSKRKQDYDSRWKLNISTRMRRIELVIFIQALLFSVHMFDKYWTNKQNVARPSSSFSVENFEKDTPVIKHIDDETSLTSNMGMREDTGVTLKKTVTSSHEKREKFSSRIIDPVKENKKTLAEQLDLSSNPLEEKSGVIGKEARRNLQTNLFVQQTNTPAENKEPNVQNVCDTKPVLTPINSVNDYIYDDRVARILNVLYSITTLGSINSAGSPSYRAACWILYDDELHIDPNDPFLIQRYALAVFLFAVKYHETDMVIPFETCNFDKIKCDDDGQITVINISE